MPSRGPAGRLGTGVVYCQTSNDYTASSFYILQRACNKSDRCTIATLCTDISPCFMWRGVPALKSNGGPHAIHVNTSKSVRSHFPFSHLTFVIRSYCCTPIKIYNEEVRDLLAVGSAGDKRDKLELKEDPSKGVYVKVCTVHSFTSVGSQESLECMGSVEEEFAEFCFQAALQDFWDDRV